MAESLGDVGCETNIRRSEPMLAMDVAIVNPADAGVFASFAIAVVPDKLGHWPWFKHGAMSAELGEIANKESHELAFAFPESCEQ